MMTSFPPALIFIFVFAFGVSEGVVGFALGILALKSFRNMRVSLENTKVIDFITYFIFFIISAVVSLAAIFSAFVPWGYATLGILITTGRFNFLFSNLT